MSGAKWWIGTSYDMDMNMKQGIYCKWQLEKCPTTEKLHFQFIVCLANKQRLTQVKSLFPGAHLEKCQSIKDGIKYCGKLDTRVDGPWEYGVCPRITEGNVVELCKTQSVRQIIEECPHLSFRLRSLMELSAMFRPPPTEGLQYWYHFYGAPSRGKSSVVKRIASFVPAGETYMWNCSKWFCGVGDASLVVGDDLCPSSPIFSQDPGLFLRLNNCLGVRVESKGSSSWLRARMLITTSNFSVEQMFPSSVDINAILRRVIQIKF